MVVLGVQVGNLMDTYVEEVDDVCKGCFYNTLDHCTLLLKCSKDGRLQKKVYWQSVEGGDIL